MIFIRTMRQFELIDSWSIKTWLFFTIILEWPFYLHLRRKFILRFNFTILNRRWLLLFLIILIYVFLWIFIRNTFEIFVWTIIYSIFWKIIFLRFRIGILYLIVASLFTQTNNLGILLILLFIIFDIIIIIIVFSARFIYFLQFTTLLISINVLIIINFFELFIEIFFELTRIFNKWLNLIFIFTLSYFFICS